MAIQALENFVRIMESQRGQPIELLATAIQELMPEIVMPPDEKDAAFACAIAELYLHRRLPDPAPHN